MNTEKQLQESNRLLKELMSRLSPIDPEENKQKQEEIDELNKSIDEYETEINKLKEKLKDDNNYSRISSVFEGNNTTVLEEMVTESIEKERVNIRRLLQEYRKGQEVETKKIRDYNSKAEQLKIEIDNIKQRLHKDEIAKESEIAKNIHLSEDEVKDLQEEITYRESLIEEANRIIDLCADEIRRYGLLITENSEHLERLKEREQKIYSFGKERIIYPKSSIDTYALRSDKDNLSKLESGLKALKNRLKVLMYNPSEEIKKQIEENEKALNYLPEEEAEDKKVFSFIENKETEIEPDTTKDEVITKELDETINKLFANNNIEEDTNVQPDPSMDTSEKVASTENLNKFINEVLEKTEIVKNEEKTMEHDTPKELDEKINELFVNKTVLEDTNVHEDSSVENSDISLFKENLKEDINKDYEQTEPKKNEEKEVVKHELEQPDEKTREELRSGSEILELYEIDNAPENLKKEKLSTKFINKWQDWRKKLSAASIELAYDVVSKISRKQEKDIPEVETNYSESNDDLGFKKLSAEGQYVSVKLDNGESVYIMYGDKQEDVPEDITIKYEGNDMYIYYPIVKAKHK